MRTRRAKIEDARDISKIQCDTIKYMDSKDYNSKQIKAWLKINRTDEVKNKIKNKKKDLFVITNKNKIVGVGSLNINKKELGSLYVNYKIHRKGIGSKLLNYVEKYAKKKGIKNLRLFSTITAFDFYKNKGYKKIRKSYHIINKVKIPCILMSKRL